MTDLDTENVRLKDERTRTQLLNLITRTQEVLRTENDWADPTYPKSLSDEWEAFREKVQKMDIDNL